MEATRSRALQGDPALGLYTHLTGPGTTGQELQERTWHGWRVHMGMTGITPEGSKEGDCSAWGHSFRLSPGQAALLRQRGYADLPALGIMAAFMEPHEELIRWRNKDKCRH